MPFVLNCPHCRGPLTLDDSLAGRVVHCPHCHKPMQCTVAQSIPRPAADPDFAASSPYRRRKVDLLPVLVAGGFGFLLIGLVGFVIWAVVSEKTKPDDDRRAVGQKEKEKGTSKEQVVPQPPVAVSRPKEARPPKAEAPPELPLDVPPGPLTFDQAYAAAEKLATKLDAAEPEETEKALKLLTVEEKIEVQTYINQPEYATLPDAAGRLRQCGMTAFLLRQSRASTRRDAENFQKVARILWDKEAGPAGIVVMMNAWGLIQPFYRNQIETFVMRPGKSDIVLTEVRNAILDLGGRKWLENR